MTSVKVMDTFEASSEALHLPPEKCINQVVESTKVRNSNGWQDLTDLIFEDIITPESELQ